MKPGIIRDNNKLETLRGFAAVFVVVQHIVIDRIDAKFNSPVLQAFRTPGNLSVLIFFMLSGYVIGISNKSNLTSSTITSYLKKRFVRIYPIYVISLILALLVSARHYSKLIIFCNFAMLQNVFSIVIHENDPIWSLNYEVLYYLLFIPISYFNINPVLVFVGSIIISFLGYFYYSSIITAYMIGLSFWIVGYIIAKKFTVKDEETKPRILLSYIFLILAMQVYHIYSTMYTKLSMRLFYQLLNFPESFYWAKVKVGYGDLFYMPFCFLVVVVFSNIKLKFRKWYMVVIHLVPLASVITIRNTIHEQNKYEIIVCSLYYLISLILFFINSSVLDRISLKFVKLGEWLGSISYGIYIIHFPILVLFSRILWFSGSAAEFLMRLFIYSLFVIGTSYLLEKKFQLWIKRLLFK